MSARRYAVWPDPRSRLRSLQSWKSFHFQTLSPPPFTMGADHWSLNKGTISKYDRPDFYIWSSFLCHVTLSWQKRQFWRVDCQSHTGLIYLSVSLPDKCWIFSLVVIWWIAALLNCNESNLVLEILKHDWGDNLHKRPPTLNSGRVLSPWFMPMLQGHSYC